MSTKFADPGISSIPVHVLEKSGLDDWLNGQTSVVQNWVSAAKFTASLGSCLTVPGADGGVSTVLFGWGDAKARARGRFHFAKAA